VHLFALAALTNIYIFFSTDMGSVETNDQKTVSCVFTLYIYIHIYIYRGWTMKLKHLVLQHNNLLVW